MDNSTAIYYLTKEVDSLSLQNACLDAKVKQQNKTIGGLIAAFVLAVGGLTAVAIELMLFEDRVDERFNQNNENITY